MLDLLFGQLCNKRISLAYNSSRHLGKVANKRVLKRFGIELPMSQLERVGYIATANIHGEPLDKRRSTAMRTTS
jgi:hypothetical protein